MVASNDADLYIASFVLCYGPKLISLVHVTKQVGVLFWQGKNSPEEMQPRDLHIMAYRPPRRESVCVCVCACLCMPVCVCVLLCVYVCVFVHASVCRLGFLWLACFACLRCLLALLACFACLQCLLALLACNACLQCLLALLALLHCFGSTRRFHSKHSTISKAFREIIYRLPGTRQRIP